MRNLAVIGGLALLAVQAQSQTPGSGASDEVVVIDGSKNPSQVPEWLAWEQGFVVLAGWHGKDSGFNHDLRETLSKDEFDAFESEALSQDERRAKAEKEAEPLQTAYTKGNKNDKKLIGTLNEKIDAINLRYRRSILDARDRVLQALSPASQAVVLAWIGDIRSSISARVLKSELARWRAPE
jgi:hypothetical protein